MDGSSGIFEDSEHAQDRTSELIMAEIRDHIHPANIEDALNTFTKLVQDIKSEPTVKAELDVALNPNNPLLTFDEYREIAKTSDLEPVHAEMLHNIIVTLADERSESANDRSHIFNDLDHALARLKQDFWRSETDFIRTTYQKASGFDTGNPGF